MSKYHRIKWRESDTTELNRVVRNFNAKVSRLAKKNPQLKNVLPEKVSVAQMKELIQTRQDLKRELNRLKRFSRRGAETIVEVPDTKHNIKITKWQKREMSIMTSVLNRRRKKRQDDIRSTKVEGQDYTLGELNMGSQGENELNPFKPFFWSMEQHDVPLKYKSLQTQTQSQYYTERDYALKERYIEAIERNYNQKDVEDIVESIKDSDMSTFLSNFRAVDLNTFEWASDVPEEDDPRYIEYVNHLRSEWLPNR